MWQVLRGFLKSGSKENVMSTETQMVEINVQGMTCAGCESHVKKALQTVTGVAKVCEVNWKDGVACVDVKAGTSSEALVQTIQKAGYQAQISSPKQEAEVVAAATATAKAESCFATEEPKCSSKATHGNDFDLVIVGSGSAAFAAAIKATELGKTVGIIEEKTLGGTCVNVGCVPSKTLIRAAESKHRIETSAFVGLEPGKARVDFSKLVQEKDSLVSHLRSAKYQSVLEANPNITLIQGRARFIDRSTLEVGNKKITSEKILIATGSSAFIPDIPGLRDSGFLTSTTALELNSLPDHIVVLGGGYIALELAQMVSRLGSRVTIVQRSEILFNEDREISEWLGKYLEGEGIEVLNHAQVQSVARHGKDISLEISRRGESIKLQANEILVATGRKPNTQGLNLEAAGIALKPNGSIQVNSYCQTTQEHIYAAGDVLDSPALVYVAAYEGNLAAENAFLGNRRQADYRTVPWVIFTDPQVSGVGLNEAQAKSQGIEYDVSLLTLDHVPRAIAARDTRGFVKLLRKTGTAELIGARVLAPEGSELIMELSLIIRYKIPLTDIAAMFHPYLTLGEAVKLAAQTFDRDVSKLSCCAS